jgi:uncharacterized membrane protein YciS (DUF1049 family)
MVTDIAWGRSAEIFNEGFAIAWELFACVMLRLQVFLRLLTLKTVGLLDVP